MQAGKKNFDTCVRVSSIAGYTAKNMLQISLEKNVRRKKCETKSTLENTAKKLSVLWKNSSEN